MKVTVCDDEAAPRDEWVERIKRANPSLLVDQLRSVDDLHKLVTRRFALRSEEGAPDWSPGRIDEADVLVVDYDLTVISSEARYTGEQLARLARLYSDCGYVIVMNQFPGIGFDLSLRGHIESYADLNIDAELIGSSRLWTDDGAESFRPWHWDDIPTVIGNRRRLASDLVERIGFDAKVVDTLGIPGEAIEELADNAFAFLDPSAENREALAEVDFRTFLMKQTEHKDAEILLTEKPILAARTAVARIAKWLSRSLLGPQDVLIDVPHLMQRMPYLIRPDIGPCSTPKEWSDLVRLGSEAIDADVVAACTFRGSVDWIGKPTFWLPSIERLERVAALRSEFDFDTVPDLVFAEDMSAFVRRSEAREFRAGHHNIHDRRYIMGGFPGVEYAPRRRLAFGQSF